MVNSFESVPACDRQMDIQTDRRTDMHAAMDSRALAQRSAAIKPNPKQGNYDDIYNVYEKNIMF